MKLKLSYETMELDDQIVAIPVGESGQTYQGVIKLNDTAAFILSLLKEEISEEDIVRILSEEFEAPKEQITTDVHEYLEEFRTRGLLEE